MSCYSVDTSFRIVSSSHFLFITYIQNKTFPEEIEKCWRDIPCQLDYSPSFPPSTWRNFICKASLLAVSHEERWRAMRFKLITSPGLFTCDICNTLENMVIFSTLSFNCFDFFLAGFFVWWKHLKIYKFILKH